MIAGWISRAVVMTALVALIVWPAAATWIDAVGDVENPGAAGLMAAPEGGAEVRPWRMAGETLRVVLGTEAIAIPTGIILAMVLFRTDLPGRRVWLTLLAVAACVPMPLHAAAWLGGFGNLGRTQRFGAEPILVGRLGAAFVHGMAALPWVVWIVGLGLIAVEPVLEETASLDLRPVSVAIRVTLRRAVGAIAGAALAVAVLTAGDMTVTDLLSIRTYAEEAYLQFGLGKGPGAAAATALPPLVVLGALIVAAAVSLLRSDPARLVSARRAEPWALGRWRWPLGLAVGVVLAGMIGIPLDSLIWRAGRVSGRAARGLPPHWSVAGLGGTLRQAVSDHLGPNPVGRPMRSPLISTLVWGSAGATVAVALAWSIAWLTRRPGPWRLVAALAAAISLATPGPVAGMALVLAYHRFAILADSPALVVMAYVVRTWPYALLLLWPAVRSLPTEYFESAEVDGVGPVGQVGRIALPLTLGAIGLAWAAAFVLAMGELPAAWIVTPPGMTSVTHRIWDKLHIGVESSLAGFVLIALVVLALAGSAVAWGVGRIVGDDRGGVGA